jgi:hypothetical protein
MESAIAPLGRVVLIEEHLRGLAKKQREAGLGGLERAKRPEPRGETDGWERYPADRYRIAAALLADLEAASHRVADIDSHVEEQSRAGEIGRARREQSKDGDPDVLATKAAQ